MLHSCGVRRNGTVWCWGYNAEGQLGNGNLANSPLPGRIRVTDDPELSDRRAGTLGSSGQNSRIVGR